LNTLRKVAQNYHDSGALPEVFGMINEAGRSGHFLYMWINIDEKGASGGQRTTSIPTFEIS
jgi:hypothetical protein